MPAIVLPNLFGTTENTDRVRELIWAAAEGAPPETGFNRFTREQWTNPTRRVEAYSLEEGAVYGYVNKLPVHVNAASSPVGREIIRICKLVEDRIEASGGERPGFNTAILQYFAPKPTKADIASGKVLASQDGKLGWHKDKGPQIVKGSAIASVVFGEARGVELRPDSDTSKVTRINPGDGDAYYMTGDTQDNETHRVLAGILGRVSITYRRVKVTVRSKAVKRTEPEGSASASASVEEEEGAPPAKRARKDGDEV